MPGERIELKPVSRITAGAVGPPGKRVFFLQARKEFETVTLLVEKQQIESLAVGVEQFLGELEKRFPDLPKASNDYSEYDMQLEEPPDPLFRAGQLGIGYDEDNDLLVLVVQELPAEETETPPGDASTARFWATRSQMLALGRYGSEICQRGRPTCGNCGQPMDPEGHFCPRRNGHKH